MAWEKRGNQEYFYRHHKIGGRPRRIYFGRGERAEQAAAEDKQRRAEAEAQRAERALLEDLDDTTGLMATGIETLARAALTLSGFFRHQRGEWRRRHGKKRL